MGKQFGGVIWEREWTQRSDTGNKIPDSEIVAYSLNESEIKLI